MAKCGFTYLCEDVRGEGTGEQLQIFNSYVLLHVRFILCVSLSTIWIFVILGS